MKGIQLLYDAQIARQPWTGPLPSSGYPPTHEILEHLGALEVEESSEDEENEDDAHFQENVKRLRHSIIDKDDAAQGSQPEAIGSSMSVQHTLLQNQHPKDYFGKTQLAVAMESSSAPSLSPDSLATANTSPSLSLDWSPNDLDEPSIQERRHSPSKIFVTGNGLSLSYENYLNDGLMQNAFEDSYLVAPWEPSDRSLVYPS